MKKRMFFGFALFVAIFMSIAWQFAVAELADIQSKAKPSIKEQTTEVV